MLSVDDTLINMTNSRDGTFLVVNYFRFVNDQTCPLFIRCNQLLKKSVCAIPKSNNVTKSKKKKKTQEDQQFCQNQNSLWEREMHENSYPIPQQIWQKSTPLPKLIEAKRPFKFPSPHKCSGRYCWLRTHNPGSIVS